jgi:PncC family amidohydrolase
MTMPSNNQGIAVSPEQRLVSYCSEFHLFIALAESCTGGLIAERITNIPGASVCFKGGVVSYANEVKQALLGVTPAILEIEGAVSETCAQAMADGARRVCQADIGLSVTGIAGPGGATPTKPVGLVFIGIATSKDVSAKKFLFSGDRASIRQQAADAALQLALQAGRGQEE